MCEEHPEAEARRQQSGGCSLPSPITKPKGNGKKKKRKTLPSQHPSASRIRVMLDQVPYCLSRAAHRFVVTLHMGHSIKVIRHGEIFGVVVGPMEGPTP